MKLAVKQFFEALGIDQKMHEASVMSRWEEYMGSTVAKRTEKKYIKDRILYIELNSSVMRDELMHQKSEIVKKVNAVAGVEIIDEVFLR